MPRVRELEQALEETQQQLRVLQRISRMMARDLSLQEALKGIVLLVAESMAAESCLLYLLDDDELVLCATSTPHAAAIGTVRLNLDEGLTGWVARERRLLSISREAYKDKRFKLFRDLPEDSYDAFLSAPVIARNHVVGVINVQHRAPHAHTGGEMELLSTVGEQAGCMVVLATKDVALGEKPNPTELLLASNSMDPSG